MLILIKLFNSYFIFICIYNFIIKIFVLEYSFQTDKILTGLDAFVFNYDVKWPVSLILNRKAIACYQMLFRHLFYCKYIERRLCRLLTFHLLKISVL